VRDLSQQMRVKASKLELASEWQAHIRQNSARSLAVAVSPGTEVLEFFRAAMAQTSRDTTATQTEFLALAEGDADSLQRAGVVGEVHTQWLAARDAINQLKAAGDDAADAEAPLQRMVDAIKRGAIEAFIPFDRQGHPVRLG